MNTIIWIIVGIFIIYTLSFTMIVNGLNKRIEKLQRYWRIEIGMSEYEMLDIMGNGYSKSLLRNNRVKYEWRINAYSYSSSYKGTSVRSYYGVKKVTIFTRNGLVEEVKPYNI